jgi:LacI family transcriptional regulator
MATLRDIAKLSGVSVGTVSYVINNQPGKVSAAKRALVLGAMRKLNYRPRPSPMRDMLPDSLTLGVTCAMMDHYGPLGYHGSVVQSILQACDILGHNAMVFATRLFHDDPLLSIRNYCDGQCAGLVVIAPGLDNPLVNALQVRNFPYVIFGDTSHPNVSSCDVDNTASARLAVDMLLDFGHRRIAYRSGYDDLASHYERLEGYRQSLMAHNIPIDERLISPPITEKDTINASWLDPILRLPAGDRPTAIFCFSDVQARSALQVIKQMGLSVPGDISLVGFDDLDVDRLDPPLSSVRQPYEQLALAAVNLLVERIRQPDAKPKHVLLPGQVMIRTSVAPICATDV